MSEAMPQPVKQRTIRCEACQGQYALNWFLRVVGQTDFLLNNDTFGQRITPTRPHYLGEPCPKDNMARFRTRALLRAKIREINAGQNEYRIVGGLH